MDAAETQIHAFLHAGGTAWRQGNLREALMLLDMAERSLQGALSRTHVEVFLQKAYILSDLGKNALARKYCIELLLTLKKPGWKSYSLRTLSLLCAIEHEMGELASSAAHHEQAIQLVAEIERDLQEGVAPSELGGLAGDMFADILDAQIVAQLELASLLACRIDVMVNGANCYCDLGRFAEAWDRLDRADALLDQAGKTQLSTRAHVAYIRGNVCYLQGRHREALEHYEGAEPVLAEHGPKDAHAACVMNLGNVYAAAGRTALAKEKYEAGLAAALAIGRKRVAAQAHLSLANLLKGEGDFEAALPHYTQARVTFEKSEDSMGVAKSCTNLGSTYLALADLVSEQGDEAATEQFLELASQHYSLAESIHASLGYSYGISHALYGRANVQRRLGNHEAAIPLLETGIHQANSANYAEEAADYQAYLADTYIVLERWEEALDNIEEAVGRLESIRAGVRGGGEKFELGWLGHRDRYYGAGVLCCARLLEETTDASRRSLLMKKAFEFAERGKSQLLVGMVASSRPDLARSDDPDLRRLWTRLEEIRNQLSQEYDDRKRLAEGNGADRAATRERLAECEAQIAAMERELDSHQEEIQRRYPELFGLVCVESPSFDQLRGLLGADTVVLEFHAIADHLMAMVIDGEGVQAVESICLKEHNLKNMVERCRPTEFYSDSGQYVTSDLDDFEAAGIADFHAAFRFLFPEPIRAALGLLDSKKLYQRLVVVPHGVLHLLPFHALPSVPVGDRWLIDEFPAGITYAPSITTLAHCRAAKKLHGFPEDILVVPDATDTLNFEAELNGIRETFGDRADLLSTREITRQAFRERSRERQAVHVCAHGVHRPEEPMGSYIVMSDGTGGTDRLTVWDVYTFSLHTTLVVLGTCLVGKSEVREGDELIGMSRGWFLAGTSSLITALWSIRDEATLELTKRFYRSWHEQPEDKGRGLRRAMIEVRGMAQHTHPCRWAPFVLLGDWQ